MPKFCLRFSSAATLTSLVFAAGCSLPPQITKHTTSSSEATSATRPVADSDSPSSCSQIDPFAKGIDKAMGAATLAQSAESRQDWDAVVSQWIQAIEGMQAVGPESPKHAFAQKKVIEYLQKLDVALQKASSTKSDLPFASFDNPIFEEQLLLYLSYVAAVGPPDVLIVGSSRALVGVDPRQVQRALAKQGKGGLKIFNFGVNGATAQFVDFQLRQLLTSEQLPRLILWADGARAFNSGRTDKTYKSIVASQGYQRLQAGDRPTLPETASETADACENIPQSTLSGTTKKRTTASESSVSSSTAANRWRIARIAFETASNPDSSPDKRLLLTQLNKSTQPQRLTLIRSTTGYSSFAIDANGFLPMDSRFSPNAYYQKKPRVAGAYDADYQSFSLSGQQAVALNKVKAFAKQKKIPLIYVNLPLTEDYLDPVRRNREQQFQQWMKQQAAEGFVFIDLAKRPGQNENFADPSHLNRYGAAAVSSQLATSSQIPWTQPRP